MFAVQTADLFQYLYLQNFATCCLWLEYIHVVNPPGGGEKLEWQFFET